MGQPRHHRLCRFDSIAQRRFWPRDHNHGQAQRAGGSQLRRNTLPTCIFGDDMGDSMGLHQRGVSGHIKRPFGDDKAAVGQGQGAGRIDQTQQEMVLVQGSKRRKVLFANRQKYTGGCAGQGRNSPRNIAHMPPVIRRPCQPRRALQRQLRQANRLAGRIGITAYLCSKGVRCVDHMANPLALQIVDQSHHTAKPAHPRGQWLWRGRIGAPRIGKDSLGPRIGQSAGSKAGLSRAPQQQDTRHV